MHLMYGEDVPMVPCLHCAPPPPHYLGYMFPFHLVRIIAYLYMYKKFKYDFLSYSSAFKHTDLKNCGSAN